MNRTTRHTLVAFAAALLLVPLAARHAAAAVTFERDISPRTRSSTAPAVLTVGRDGNVYLSSVVHDGGYILRVSRDGTQKLGGDAVYAMANATANAAGVVASANAHFNHSLNLYHRDLKQFAACNEFLVNDRSGGTPRARRGGGQWRFLRPRPTPLLHLARHPAGKVVQVYAVPQGAKAGDFRVCEAVEALYLRAETARCGASDSTAPCGGRRRFRKCSP